MYSEGDYFTSNRIRTVYGVSRADDFQCYDAMKLSGQHSHGVLTSPLAKII